MAQRASATKTVQPETVASINTAVADSVTQQEPTATPKRFVFSLSFATYLLFMYTMKF